MSKRASKPRAWRVWVRDDPSDELRRFGAIMAHGKDTTNGGTVRATLTLDDAETVVLAHAAKAARDILRIVAKQRRKFGALSTHAQQAAWLLSIALGETPEPTLDPPQRAPKARRKTK